MRIRRFSNEAARSSPPGTVPKRMPKQELFPNAALADGPISQGRVRDQGVKVVIVTPAHQTYADVRVFQKEARTLAAHGYQVTLFAQAKGRMAPFVEEGVRVVPLNFPTRGHMVVGLPRLFRRLLREKADLYHLHNPFSLPLILALKAARRKVIYDVHEDYIERIRIRDWLPRVLRVPTAYFVGGLEILVGKLVDGAIATQPEVADRLGSRAIILENAPMVNDEVIDRAEAFARTIPDEVANPEGAFRLVYAGSISRVRGLPSMMDALGLVNEETPARLWLIGPPDDEQGIADAMRHPAWRYVDFIGRLEHQHEVFGHMLRANVGLALFRDWGGYARISSNKLYEYMASGVPFVASAFPRWQARLESVKAGFFCEPTDSACVALNLLDLINDPDKARRMGEKGRTFVRAEFNWDTEQAKLLALYQRVLGEHQHPL